MKILLMSPLPPPEGGIATFTKELLSSFHMPGCSFTLVNTAVCGRRKKNPQKRYFGAELWRTIKTLRETKKALKQERHILHLSSSLSCFGVLRDLLAVRLAKRFGAPVLLHCHCNVADTLRRRFQRTLVNRLCSRADVTICLNKDSERRLLKLCGTPAMTLPNFLSDEIMKEIPASTTAKVLKKAVFVGSVCREKGCDAIIKAARDCPDIQFTLVGRADERVMKKDFPENICLTGPLPPKEIYKTLLTADVFLFPSRSEGFPLAVLEAMAAGLPILATKVGAIPEMLGENAVFLKKDGGDLKEKLYALRDMEKRREMAVQNKKRAETLFSASAVLPKLYREYIKLWEKMH